MKSDALTKAIRACGSAKELASRLGISIQAVSQWREVPVGRVLDVERATGIPRRELRPDLFGDQPAAAQETEAA